MDRLEQYATEQNHVTIVTHASVTACPFFQGRNYQVIKEQQVERHGVFFEKYAYAKDISYKIVF